MSTALGTPDEELPKVITRLLDTYATEGRLSGQTLRWPATNLWCVLSLLRAPADGLLVEIAVAIGQTEPAVGQVDAAALCRRFPGSSFTIDGKYITLTIPPPLSPTPQ